jgi:hypothetical protein
MMQRISKSLNSVAELAAFVAVSNEPLSGLNMQFSFQCASTSSPNFGLFYDVVGKSWLGSPVWNPLTPQTENPGIYVSALDTSTLNEGRSENYFVTYKSFTPSTPFIETEMWQFGGGVDQLIADLHDYHFASSKTLSRVLGDYAIQESYFDVAGKERFRFISTQDPSGNQPEETRTNVSENIV